MYGKPQRNVNVEPEPPKKTVHEIICPYCFKRYMPDQVVFRVNYDLPIDENYKKKPDEKLDIYRRKIGLAVAGDKEIVIDPKNHAGLMKSLHEEKGILLGITDSKDEYTDVRLCPHCHKDLPITSGKGPTKVISLIGNTSAGKTIYLTMLLRELFNSTALNFDAGCIAIDSQYLDIINENEERLYYQGEVLPPSPKETRIEPLVLCLGFSDARRAPVTLIFYDVAGEGMLDAEYVKKRASHIENSDGIIFLIDPLRNEIIKEKLAIKKSIEEDKPGSGEANVPLTRGGQFSRVSADGIVTVLFKSFIAKGAEVNTSIPTAVIVSKSDMLNVLEGSDISANSNIFRNYKHKVKLNLNQVKMINGEVENFLSRVDSKLITALRYFSNKQFFAVSSLGCNPVNMKISNAIAPIRVDEPFLWLLYKWGLIEEDRGSLQ